MGNPEGPRSLAAPHRMRSLLPLGRRVESCLLGWCGPAKPLRPPRFHTFPHQILIHRCTPRFGSTTSRPTPPPPRRRVVLLWFFVAFAVLNVDPTCSIINAAAALMQLFMLLPPCMSPNWASTTVIQAPHLRAQPLRLVLALLAFLLADPVRPSVRVGSRRRIARLVRQISFFLLC